MGERGNETASMIYLVYDRSMPTDKQRKSENQQRYRTPSSFWDDMRTFYHLCCSPLFQFCFCARISPQKRAISGQQKPLRAQVKTVETKIEEKPIHPRKLEIVELEVEVAKPNHNFCNLLKVRD